MLEGTKKQTNDESLSFTLSEAKQFLYDRGFKRVCVTRAGGTITSHCGEDCLGILYINDGTEVV